MAAVQDFRTAKIRNLLILTGMLTAILVNSIYFIREESSVHVKCFQLAEQIGNILILFIILYALYKAGALGAGDCKLLLMIGMYLPIKKSIEILIGSLVLAAVYGTVRNMVRIIWLKKERIAGIHYAIPVAIVHVLVVLQEKI